MKDVKIGTLIFALLITLATGGLSAALSSRGMAIYGTMNKPPLSPPAWVFSIAWTILYIMMGLSLYMVMTSDGDPKKRRTALILFAVQLVMNFMWSLVFFNLSWYLFAFVWLIGMWVIVIACAVKFFTLNKTATLLFIPYILWLTFAAYLNMGAYILSPKG